MTISRRGAAADPQLWTDVNDADIVLQGERRIVPDRYRTLALNADALQATLAMAPMEFSEGATTETAEILLPLPDGSMERFGFVESPVMEAGLGAKFPEIKSYVGRGLDDPALFTRFGWTYKGFHAVIFNSNATIYIDPYSTGDLTHYISYSRTDFTRSFSEPFVQQEPVIDPQVKAQIEDFIAENPEVVIGEQLRTYRLALATTGEYSIYHSNPNPPNVSDVLSELNVVVNRVNGVYERDAAVRMVLIANNDLIIFLNPNTDPYSNNNGGAMLGQNQSTLDSIIGNANYDIGHVLSTGGGGVAYLGVPCRTGEKARGVTGLANPVGDPFYIDYVAHEMGHQYGAEHTFNGTAGSCGGGNRNASTAFEPGSGTTIMAYAGICGNQNIQPNSDDHFHTSSIQEIVAYTTGSFGNACPVISNTGNSAPTANAGAGGFYIPINTPFILTGTGTDPNSGDVLTYNWEEYDLGPAGHPNNPVDNAPIYRSFPSVSDPFRVFPQISDIVNNTQTLGEILPSYTRSLNFRLTVRDNNIASGAGGVHYNLINFQVTNSAGPFLVTNPNTAVTWTTGADVSVAWNVANTSSAPVNCNAVNVALSTDGGYTYPITLATGVPNNGSTTVVAPNNPTTTARVRVMCANNIFFDISNTNFTITSSSATPTPTSTPVSPTPTATSTPTATAGNTPTPTNTPGPMTCTIYPSVDVPKSIPASGTPSVNSVLNVPESGTIVDVNVRNLNGAHTFINNLDFNLTSPLGMEVQVMAQSCSGEDGFNLNLDDEASGTWPCPPLGGGTYQPSNPLSAFDGQNSAGAWTLRVDDNANQDGGRLLGWGLEICVGGTGATPTVTSEPPTPTNTPDPSTATNTPTPPAGSSLIYLSSATDGSIGGVSYSDEDIIVYNTVSGLWAMHFDGSDTGITTEVNGFDLLPDGSILLTFETALNVPGVGSVDDSDIVQFFPTSIGTTTAGTYAMYFDGSDVGLSANSENLDAVGLSPDGQLLLSTVGAASVPGASGADEDLLIFTASTLGSSTSGTWNLHFDGSDVGLTSTSEDVNGSWPATNGDIYLSTLGNFSVTGVTGTGSDIFICDPGSTGSATTCTFSMYWDGSAHGYGAIVDGFEIAP